MLCCTYWQINLSTKIALTQPQVGAHSNEYKFSYDVSHLGLKWRAVWLGALTTFIYHTQYTRGSLVRTPDRYLGRLWVRILSETRIFFVAPCSLELFMFSQWAANWPTFIYRISQKTNKYQPCFFHKTSLHTITVFLLTSASLSLCTPAKSNASLRNPCLSVRSMDAITARHSCHTLFQFPCLSGSDGLELPWDWGAFDMNSKFGLMCYYLIGHGRIAQFSGDSKLFPLQSSLTPPWKMCLLA